MRRVESGIKVVYIDMHLIVSRERGGYFVDTFPETTMKVLD